jgi:hypothetical protein
MTTMNEDKLDRLVATFADHIVAAYREAVAAGYPHPFVTIRIRGDLDRDSGVHVDISPTGADLERLVRACSPADEGPVGAIELYNDFTGVPPGHFMLAVVDDSGMNATYYPIPD